MKSDFFILGFITGAATVALVYEFLRAYLS